MPSWRSPWETSIRGWAPSRDRYFRQDRKGKKLITLWRAFRSVGSPYILPPRYTASQTPKERVAILEAAMQKTFKDPEFPPYFKKLVSDDASPMGAAELRKLIAEMPRNPETIDTFKKFAGSGPLPPR